MGVSSPEIRALLRTELKILYFFKLFAHLCRFFAWFTHCFRVVQSKCIIGNLLYFCAGNRAGVLKDYLRELPEPLLTKSLYHMLVDALSVCLPDDPEGNARLLFSIIECLPKPNRVRKSNIFIYYLENIKWIYSIPFIYLFQFNFLKFK